MNTELLRCELLTDHLSFSRYFFKQRQNIKFRVNWHHRLISDVVQDIIEGKRKNVVVNVPPGSSKTELVVINFIARGLALNPHSRFLHLSYSDDLALLNSQTARDMIKSEEYQALWKLKISDDTQSKKRWNVEIDGKPAGGVYATSLSGQVTGFRAGRMEKGWQGALIVDDPLKPEDAFSKTRLDAANRRLLTTVRSRLANPDIPIILIMQRIAENDPTGFIKQGSLGPDWSHVVIPAVIDDDYVKTLPSNYQPLVEKDAPTRFSYWPYKEPISELLNMEQGGKEGSGGARVSRHVFTSQYQQNPTALGGNILKGEWFGRYKQLPKLEYRKIFVDTAQKTAERNDYSVLECWGRGVDGGLYLVDLIRGKWEAPELEKRTIAFWNKHFKIDPDLESSAPLMRRIATEKHGQLRQMVVEDKSSGTGLIQKIKTMNHIPIKGIERVKDKLTRVMDVVGYLESKCVWVPEDAWFTNDFVSECEAFTADDTHAHDDQIDPMIDAIVDMLSTGNKLKMWEKLI